MLREITEHEESSQEDRETRDFDDSSVFNAGADEEAETKF